MRRLALALAAPALTAVLVGCGGGNETKTVVQTVTTPPPSTTPAPDSTVPTTDTGPTATTPVTKPPLPGGRAAVDGTYRLVLKRYAPKDMSPVPQTTEPSSWFADTQCAPASGCTVTLRRPLRSGGFKEYPMRPDGPRNYSAEVTGEITGQDVDPLFPCFDQTTARTRERASVRVTKIATADGRPTATALDAYLVIRGHCGDRDRRTPGPFRLTASFRGARGG